MLKFSIGIGLIIFSIFVGSFKYFDNVDQIAAKERAVKTAERQSLEIKQFSSRFQRAAQSAIPKGQDKRANVQRMLSLDGRSLELTYTREDNNNQSRMFYHEYLISGEANFERITRLLSVVANAPGFTINSVCLNCKHSVVSAKGLIPIEIRGRLYVTNGS